MMLNLPVVWSLANKAQTMDLLLYLIERSKFLTNYASDIIYLVKWGLQSHLILLMKFLLQCFCKDRFVKASPACQRAVLETVGALRRVGHECVEVEVPERAFIVSTWCLPFIASCLTSYSDSKPLELFVGLASADGYETLLSPVGSDPMVSPVRQAIPYICDYLCRFITGFWALTRRPWSQIIRYARPLRHVEFSNDGTAW